ncbi:unnamed protein product [Mytilus coruscus]|uniref:Uncharacterized protein n=1 Tax=Mytilus coruscus TaxID=42192 RepID=A0A6J8E190_MYTCO|nr:unnamed protein product [Mytilus coruscus]
MCWFRIISSTTNAHIQSQESKECHEITSNSSGRRNRSTAITTYLEENQTEQETPTQRNNAVPMLTNTELLTNTENPRDYNIHLTDLDLRIGNTEGTHFLSWRGDKGDSFNSLDDETVYEAVEQQESLAKTLNPLPTTKTNPDEKANTCPKEINIVPSLCPCSPVLEKILEEQSTVKIHIIERKLAGIINYFIRRLNRFMNSCDKFDNLRLLKSYFLINCRAQGGLKVARLAEQKQLCTFSYHLHIVFLQIGGNDAANRRTNAYQIAQDIFAFAMYLHYGLNVNHVIIGQLLYRSESVTYGGYNDKVI